MPTPPTLTVPAGRNGPTSSGNGGWTAGALAARLVGHSGVQVTLRQPPPLDRPMAVDLNGPAGDGAGLRDGETLVAEAEPAALDADATVAPVGAGEARAAEAAYAGHRSHPFPDCFVCGTARAEGEGLRIFPGRVADDAEGRARVAATWTPHPGLGPPDLALAWAALDCAGGWAGDLEERLMVLGRMSAEVLSLPETGVEHVVVGGARGDDGPGGRRTRTATTLYGPDGAVVGRAAHVWFAVDPKDFR